jgi:hypothetical protein
MCETKLSLRSPDKDVFSEEAQKVLFELKKQGFFYMAKHNITFCCRMFLRSFVLAMTPKHKTFELSLQTSEIDFFSLIRYKLWDCSGSRERYWDVSLLTWPLSHDHPLSPLGAVPCVPCRA